MDLQLRDLDPDDLSRSFDIRTRAFGALHESVRPQWEKDVLTAIDAGRLLAAYDGDLLVARAMIRPFVQYWGGRAMPMAGIAGVVVSPEYRGRGVGSGLIRFTARRGRELGYPVSALYPATIPVYRGTGWEIAGVWPRYTITTRLLRELRGERASVREVGPQDAAALLGILRAQYAADDGFVIYGWEKQDLVVHCMVAGSVATARALWSVVGSGSSVAKKVLAYLAPDDPIHHVLDESVSEDVHMARWMLRLLDVEAALATRGYPGDVDVDVPLVLEDAELEENRLAGRLEVRGGVGRFVGDASVATSGEAVRLGPNGLAALYAGTATASLRSSGLVDGGSPALLGCLDAAFVGRPAYLLEYF